jgi:Holliday junction resolvase
MIPHANRKSKGTKAERDLIHMFWDAGWAAFRAAGSGSMPVPCPDVIAGNIVRKLAIEVKVTADTTKYFTAEEINDLIKFSQTFGAEPWLGIKFDREGWHFVNPEDLKKTEKNYSVKLEVAKDKGLSFEQLTKGFS